MKLNRWLIPAALAAVLAMAAGCKKENTEDYKSLSGTISLDMPVFVQTGYTKTFAIDTLMTVTCPENYPVGYYFTDPETGKRDTLVTADGVVRKPAFTLKVKDSLATRNLTLSAFVKSDAKYSALSGSASYVVVKSGLDGKGSITHFNASSSAGSMKDARDGKEYYYTDVDGLSWLRQNLAWEGAGQAYWNCNVMSDIFGRYYTWEEAQTACPEGWRLPTDAEWTALQAGAEAGKDINGLAGKLMGDLYFNGAKMWEYWREVKITDELHFSALPAGYATVGEGDYHFQAVYSYAAFWTSDEADGRGVCRYISPNKDIVYRGQLSKSGFAASVRCVKEK
ncbi:MAG: hypothetical protein J6W98_04155 [Bacteroidales bacterium]|nr:hypothetical protein [Bacteroidales bacterium]